MCPQIQLFIRGVRSFFNVRGQDLSFLLVKKVDGQLSIFSEGEAKKWVSNCPSCPPSSDAPVYLSITSFPLTLSKYKDEF